MRTSLAALGIAALLLSGNATATLRIVEQGVETTTLSVSLPDEAAGSISVTPCGGCKPLLLQLAPSSLYFIGKAAVSYAELKSLARSSARQLDIFYEAKGRTITRLVVSGQRPAQTRQPRQ